jgi:hypothetical protein
MKRVSPRWLLLALAPLGCHAAAASADAGGCGSAPAEAPDGGPPSTFIAFNVSFDCFHQWSSAPAVAEGDASDGLHGVGPLRVYWNENPPHGATSFPVGTIIVKETEEPDVTQRTTFAMVKRGGGYNDGGAAGWEWFSLLDAPDGTVAILWRGIVAPETETYAGRPIGDCNGCHVQAIANDFVWDTALQLSSF